MAKTVNKTLCPHRNLIANCPECAMDAFNLAIIPGVDTVRDLKIIIGDLLNRINYLEDRIETLEYKTTERDPMED